MAKEITKLIVREVKTGKTDAKAAPDFLRSEVNEQLVAQAVRVERQRRRIRTAHTKGRSEVRGGGAKPWRQKGTGRARHGSRRSPIWVGGGITFGPRADRNLKKRIPIKMRRLALSGLLAEKFRAGELEVWRWDKALPVKTDELAKMKFLNPGALLVVSEGNKDIARVALNMPKVIAIRLENLSCGMIMGAKMVLIDEESWQELEGWLEKPKQGKKKDKK